MLNEIINKVAEKTGISTETAATAVTTVLDFLKQKLPAPIATQIEGLLSGSSSAADAVSQAKEKASGVFEEAKEKLGSFFHKK